MRKMLDNIALIFLVVVVTGGFLYSIYQGLFQNTDKKADQAISNSIKACQTNLAKAVIFEQFAREAAAARRAQAAADFKAGDEISAKNNLATAERYESFATQWDALTVKDCRKEYGL
jgi:hypothetical protein